MSAANKHIVIIGGGAAGLSTAYHLGKRGCPNVLLLEQNQLTSGTSWHAAGIVGPLRTSRNLTTLAKYALELFPRLEAETGQATGYKQTGGLWLTREPARLSELQRIAAMGEMHDLPGAFLTPGQVKERFAMINVDDLVGAMWLDQDGQVNPVDMCMAFTRGARANGVEIREHSRVCAIDVENGLATAVVLDSAERIECDVVVNCAGLWARHIGQLAGVNVPLHAVEHMYVVTEPVAGMPLPWPVIRDMEGALYIKEDAGKLVLGAFKPNAKLWDHKSVDPDASFLIFEQDWDHIEPMMNGGIHRIPRLETLGLTDFMTGPESFTPDTRQLMGISPEVENFFVAAGFNSLGIMSAPGVGKVMADWIVRGRSPIDLWEVDIARFQPDDNHIEFLRQRIPEAVSNQFDLHWPDKQYKTGRCRKVSVWHEKMAEMGAVFGCTAGWERPLWFARDNEPGQLEYSYDDQIWWPVAARESKMLEKSGALFDLSSFTKIILEGAGATDALQWICSNNIDVEVGKIVYTLMLNPAGGIESELTVSRLLQNRYLLVAAVASRTKDRTWIVRNTRQFDVRVTDITDDYAVLGVMGPNAKALLGRLSSQNFAIHNFPFGRTRMIDIHHKNRQIAEVRALRLSFVGEQGWELFMPNACARDVLNAVLTEAGQFKMAMAGFFTLECCRLEKGYLHWGHDIGPEENPYQAGLGFAVRLDKPGGFVGLAGLEKILQAGISRKLVLFEAKDSRPLLLHDEPLSWQDKRVGRTTSGGVGLRTGKALCFGYVDLNRVAADKIPGGEFTVLVQGEIHTLIGRSAPPYDPAGARMRG